MKALVIDDDRVVRVVLREILSGLDFEVVEAEDGRQGLALMARERPDLVVLDLIMPELGGPGVLQAIRSSSLLRNIPVVCCSAVDDREQIVHLAGMGVADYLLKPIEPHEARRRLAAILGTLGASTDVSDSSKPRLLLVHPDPNFRTFAGNLLRERYHVLATSSGHQAEQAFAEDSADSPVVCLGENLSLRGEDQLVGILRAIARERDQPLPSIYLIAASETVDPEKAARYQGVIHRSLMAEEFLQEFDRVVGAAPTTRQADG